METEQEILNRSDKLITVTKIVLPKNNPQLLREFMRHATRLRSETDSNEKIPGLISSNFFIGENAAWTVQHWVSREHMVNFLRESANHIEAMIFARENNFSTFSTSWTGDKLPNFELIKQKLHEEEEKRR